MRRKRHAYPAQVLADLITALEVSDAPVAAGGPNAMKVLRGYHTALLDVLSRGPVSCIDAWLRESAHPNGTLTPDETLLLRAELLQLFRSAVRQGESGQPSSTIWLHAGRPIAVTARVVEGGRVNLALDGPEARELILLQVLLLLQEVGLLKRTAVRRGGMRASLCQKRTAVSSVPCSARNASTPENSVSRHARSASGKRVRADFGKDGRHEGVNCETRRRARCPLFVRLVGRRQAALEGRIHPLEGC